MNYRSIAVPLSAAVALCAIGCSTGGGAEADALFQKKCAMCHPNGGNVIRGNKGLQQDALERNGLKNAADIVNYLRKPGPDMPAFDNTALPDRDATALAEYILKTF